VLVWFLQDDIRVIEIAYPKLSPTEANLGTSLGAAEAKLPSLLSQDWDQWVYASRGLSLHVERKTQKVAALFAYPTMSVEEFRNTDISRVAKSEDPVEQLR